MPLVRMILILRLLQISKKIPPRVLYALVNCLPKPHLQKYSIELWPLRCLAFSDLLRSATSALAAIASRPLMQPTAAAEDFYPRRWCRHSPSALSPSIHTADQHQQQLKAVRSAPRLIPSSPLPQMDVCVLHILCCRSYQHLLWHPSIQLSFDQKWDHLKSSFNQE